MADILGQYSIPISLGSNEKKKGQPMKIAQPLPLKPEKPRNRAKGKHANNNATTASRWTDLLCPIQTNVQLLHRSDPIALEKY
jgi:hypothetical protein